MSSIVPSSGSGAVSTSAGAPSGSKSVDDHAWDVDVLELDGLGLVLPHLGGAPMAEMFAPDKGVFRVGQDHTRRRTGWRAFRTGIVVVRQTQRLQPRADGRFSPAGPWSTQVTTHLAVAEPRRRTGDVLADDRPDGIDAGGSTGPDSEALSQLAYLPAVVRSGFLGALPRAELFSAEAQQTRYADRLSYSVRALRLSAPAAVVLQAGRDAGARTWRVEQASYAFASGLAQVGS